MFLSILKRAVKNALHSAVEEWALECGLPRKLIKEMHAQRLALAAQADALADQEAACALGVEDEDDVIEVSTPPFLTMPSAARLTSPDACPGPDQGDDALMEWVQQQREARTTWAEVAHLANEAGHSVTEDALRMRHGRWKERTQALGSE
jgi:hypothetical protein